MNISIKLLRDYLEDFDYLKEWVADDCHVSEYTIDKWIRNKKIPKTANKIIHRILEKIKRPPILYHYCSRETFKSILENRSFILSDASKSNDSKEGIWAQDILNDLLEKKPFLKNIYEKSFLKMMEEIKEEKIRNYILCFSEEADLSGQWRSYAEKGRGFAIGVNIRTLNPIKIESLGEIFLNGELCNREMVLGKVIYDIKTQKKMIENVIKKFNIENSLFLEKNSDTLNNKTDQLLFLLLEQLNAYRFLNLSLLIKHPGFRDEKEWRIYFPCLEKYIQNLYKENINNLKWRISAYGFASYLEWKFPDTNFFPAKEIYIGSNNNETKESIKELLKYYSYNNFNKIKIIKSTLPIRW